MKDAIRNAEQKRTTGARHQRSRSQQLTLLLQLGEVGSVGFKMGQHFFEWAAIADDRDCVHVFLVRPTQNRKTLNRELDYGLQMEGLWKQVNQVN